MPAKTRPLRPTIIVEVAHDWRRMRRLGVDWVLVNRALEGDIKAKRQLNDREWAEVLRQAAARRWNTTQITDALHISFATLTQRARRARVHAWSAEDQPPTTTRSAAS